MNLCRVWIGAVWLGLSVMSGSLPAAGEESSGASSGSNAPEQVRLARIGILAYRGVDATASRWHPLADYLSAAVDGWRFELVPLTLASAPQRIEMKDVDFVITNPGHYVTLAERFGLSALATRERAVRQIGGDPAAGGLLQFGTVIFVRKDSGIQALDDLKDRRIAAVSPDAFGGFQMAWFELQAQNIDIFQDTGSIHFMGFPQDDIIVSVLDGEADAGIVRSGLLELIAAEGRLSLDDVRVLNANMQLDYPHRISSRLYPEWPLAALSGIDKTLRENVTLALLHTQLPAVSGTYDLQDIWSAPLAYDGVRELISAYRNRMTRQSGVLANSGLVAMLSLAAAVIGLTALSAFAFLRRRPVLLQPAAPDLQADPDPLLDQMNERFETLTRRERQILALICSGHQTKNIADRLHISPKTVEFHRSNLLQKTKAGTTPHLVQLATRLGFDQGLSLG